MAIDETRMNALMSRAVNDLGATMHAALVLIGDKLGLYKALAKGGPLKPSELAARTGTRERYVREWLNAQAAGGYVTYSPTTGTYSLDDEQSFAFTALDLPGAFMLAAGLLQDEPTIAEAFTSGRGVGWHEHHPTLFEGTERFFRPSYSANLITSWIPSLTNIEVKLQAGGKVADVGCGHGVSTVLLALAYPKSRFFGFDYHDKSIERARAVADAAGLGDNVRFDVAMATDFPGTDYDLVAFFDCLHDMGDPVAALRHVREVLNKKGSVMIVEPFAHDKVEENFNPLGRLFYCASTMVCTPASLSQQGQMGLGAQAGERQLREVAERAGFTRFRRAAETPTNLVFEARL